MLIEFKDLEAREPRTMERVSQTIHHLLRHQFIHTDDRGSASLLEIVRRPTTGALLGSFFDTAGYKLVLRESEGWAGILPDTERMAPPRMRIEETLVLLVLARLWQEGVQDGEVGEYSNVLTTLNDAYDAYQGLASRSRRAALRIEAFRDIVHELARRAVVRLHGYDEEFQDQELTIRPIVTLLAGEDFLATIEIFLQEHEVPAEEEEEGPEAATDGGAP
ncbi:DUF4194 domain-containing protein [Labrys monachus]|uniref:DUF4194 domain-containing protein n=1 Tax=Labrys monachus TaxID=217067 RepID=A0ABU0FFR6_9HYPH|nr:DUF4194 domain-containing protein [Labrys monachus]MDQ0392880.1 hypothetical protein [Labrys monachus]